MRLIIYDTEVFKFDWVAVFKDVVSGQHTVVHNDNEMLKECISDDCVYIGFNTKAYDQFIIKGIVGGFDPQELKHLNDFLISGGRGWDYPELKDIFFSFNNVDIRDDMFSGLSLKAIEGHMGMDIQETEVSFDLDRQLTEAELQQTIHYCIHDVDATHELIKLRADYLKTKRNLGKRAGISEVKSLAATNAKLTAMLLKASRHEWHDGRDYVYPENLDTAVIPKPVLDFFETIHDKSIPDEELFKTSFEIVLGDMPCKYAWGGVHGSLTGYHEKAEGSRVIQNRDVSSLYPSLIEIYHYLSRNVPDPELFYAIRKDRIQAKHNGDKQTAKDLKLPLNTVSGAQENQYNDLYDPLPTRSMRISGQLFLTVLTMRLLNACRTIKLLNLNTDGLMYSIDASELSVVDEIAKQWEAETKFELEVDEIQEVWIKDVNNLLMVKTNGEVKTVGGYLNYGVSMKGAWSINNNMIIVKKALINCFTKGIPVEDTINASTDIFDFQIIAKAGAKYKEAYTIVNGLQTPVQKVNRVYATADERYGKIYKVKTENDAAAKIEMLPEHCIIDNDNHCTLDDVDRNFYIEVAKKRINDFMGIKPEKKGKKKNMATTANIYKRLATVREKFLANGVKKTGKNAQLKSLYFQLDDIVPIATPLFHEQNLIPLVNFTKDECTLTVLDMLDENNKIVFTAPVREWLGNAAVTPVQAMGATITYMRRYLYQIALDIVEVDEMESGATPTHIDSTKPVAPAAAPVSAPARIPLTAETREAVAKKLSAPEGNASDLQITQLKKGLKNLRTKFTNGSKEEWIAKIAVETKGFKEITKSRCEEILTQISDLMGGEANG